MVALSRQRHHGPPGTMETDWRSNRWRQLPLARGLRFAYWPGVLLGQHDYASGHVIGSPSSAATPAIVGDPHFGMARRFDGSDDVLIVADSSDFGNRIFAGADKKFSITVDCSQLSGQMPGSSTAFIGGLLFGKYEAESIPDGQIGLWANSTAGGAKVQFGFYGGSLKYGGLDTVNHYTGPRTVTVIYDGSLTQSDRAKLYIDGIEAATTYSTNGTVSEIRTASHPLSVGGESGTPDGAFPYRYTGKISRVFIHDRVLSPSEIWQLAAPQTLWDLIPVRGKKRHFTSSTPSATTIHQRRLAQLTRVGSRSAIAC